MQQNENPPATTQTYEVPARPNPEGYLKLDLLVEEYIPKRFVRTHNCSAKLSEFSYQFSEVAEAFPFPILVIRDRTGYRVHIWVDKHYEFKVRDWGVVGIGPPGGGPFVIFNKVLLEISIYNDIVTIGFDDYFSEVEISFRGYGFFFAINAWGEFSRSCTYGGGEGEAGFIIAPHTLPYKTNGKLIDDSNFTIFELYESDTFTLLSPPGCRGLKDLKRIFKTQFGRFAVGSRRVASFTNFSDTAVKATTKFAPFARRIIRNIRGEAKNFKRVNESPNGSYCDDCYKAQTIYNETVREESVSEQPPVQVTTPTNLQFAGLELIAIDGRPPFLPEGGIVAVERTWRLGPRTTIFALFEKTIRKTQKVFVAKEKTVVHQFIRVPEKAIRKAAFKAVERTKVAPHLRAKELTKRATSFKARESTYLISLFEAKERTNRISNFRARELTRSNSFIKAPEKTKRQYWFRAKEKTYILSWGVDNLEDYYNYYGIEVF